MTDTQLPPMGFLAVEVDIHRPPGDPFNEKTWPFPLIRETVKGTSESQIVTKESYDDAFIERFVAAGIKLAERGAVGILTSCGFLALAQTRDFLLTPSAWYGSLADKLPIPIAASALIQIPSLRAILPRRKKIGVMTYDDNRLGNAHFTELGIDPEWVRISGAPADGHLRGICSRGERYDVAKLEKELVEQARRLVESHDDIAIVVLECTNMPPYAAAIQEAINRPVYDVFTMGTWFYSGLVRGTPPRWIS